MVKTIESTTVYNTLLAEIDFTLKCPKCHELMVCAQNNASGKIVECLNSRCEISGKKYRSGGIGIQIRECK